MSEKLRPGPGQIAVFTRQEGYINPLSDYRLVRIGHRGELLEVVSEPPRERGLVIGIGKDDKVIIAFPKNRSEAEGFHEICEGYVIRHLKGEKNARALLHGFIYPESRHTERRALHILRVFKMHPRDVGQIWSGTAGVEQWERGKIEPEKYISPDLARGLMSTLRADMLEVVYARPAHAIYGLQESSLPLVD